MIRRRNTIGVLVATVLGLAVSASPALAAQGIDSFETTLSTTQAGGHPNMTTSFELNSPGAPEAARNIEFNAPEGVFGNPNAVTKCTRADFAVQRCTPNAQVGLMTLWANVSGNPHHLLGTTPIFVIEPEVHQTALFAIYAPELNIPILIPVTVRTGSDYGLRFTVSEISQQTPLAEADMTFWGFPAEDAHNNERFDIGSPGAPAGCPGLADTSCIKAATRSTLPDRPLTSNPTVCTGQQQVTRLTIQTYQDPDNRSEATSTYPPVDGCERVTFAPVLQAGVTTPETDAASGLDVILRAPHFLGRAASPSHIRLARVILPPGLTVNPDAADGQTACTDAQAKFGQDVPSQCPETSKIGTFEIGTPALDGPLQGSLYLGEPKPGNQYRIVMVANGFGINAKLVSSVVPDPETGQVELVTQELPQVSFEEFRLHLFSADRGLMATPIHCSLYAVEAQFFPWNDALADQTSKQFFGLNSGPGGKPCPPTQRPFSPRLVAGTTHPVAGAFSDFSLQLDRDDGDQFIRDLNFTMPEGFTGSLRGIVYCPEPSIQQAIANTGRAEQAAPSCPASSQVGTSNVASGPGTHPFHSIGRMYMAGPLKGAPLSLVVVTPALAGPYDYGVVVVRVALHIDPLTAQVRAVSDTVPLIIGGIPLRMRSIRVNIDRPNFTINPTSCAEKSIDSQGVGDQGAIAHFSSFFVADDCAGLGFKPKMTVRQLGGKSKTRRATNPELQFDLRTRAGDANIKSIAVTLPKAFEIDQRHLGNLCSEKELVASQCAGRTAIGKAFTQTPLLDQPLSGPAYAVSGSGGLPRLAFVLNGQITIIPRADAKTVKGRLRTTVPVVPDAPIGHFRLNVFGGKQGYLINTRNICDKPPVIRVDYEAQNGKSLSQNVKVRTACGKGKARRKRGAEKR